MPNLWNDDCINVFPTLADGSMDLIVSDPPYGINYRSNRQQVDRLKSVKENQSVNVRPHYFSTIENDNGMFCWLVEAYRVLKEGSAIYVFCHWTKWSELERHTQEAGFDIKNMIVLNKSNHGMGDLKGQYAPKHELLMFACKGRHVCRWRTGRQQDVWNVPVVFSGSHRHHPNEKPISWLTPAILNSSDEGQLILDPFMGAGSTGIAAVKSKRHFVGIELDKTYYESALIRISEAQEDVKSEVDFSST
jgi:site-specific DNA-methyltransferase (adenine-specific)